MDDRFKAALESLEDKLKELVGGEPFNIGDRRPLPQSGVYLLSEGTSHLYVGRTNNSKTRLAGHASGNPTRASFAFRQRGSA